MSRNASGERKMQRLREDIGGGKYHIHLDAGDGDGRTLCGYAYEGSCTDGKDHGVVPVARGKVNCRTCLGIIRYCKSVPAKMLASRN